MCNYSRQLNNRASLHVYREVAEIVNLHYQTVIRYDKEGRLRFQRTGANRCVLFQEDLLRYLNEKGGTVGGCDGTDYQFQRKVVLYGAQSIIPAFCSSLLI